MSAHFTIFPRQKRRQTYENVIHSRLLQRNQSFPSQDSSVLAKNNGSLAQLSITSNRNGSTNGSDNGNCRKRLSKTVNWVKQSVVTLSFAEEAHYRWKRSLQKRTNNLQRELQANPMLPFECIRDNSLDLLRDLLNEHHPIIHQTDQKGSLLIHRAVSAGLIGIVELLVSYGADLGIPDEKGNYPSHLCAISGNLEIFEYLIDLNVDMSRRNREGLEPIHLLAIYDHVELMKKLLELADIDVEAPGEGGSTPIHYCCIHDSVKCLQTLIAHGANMYKPNDHQTYPIHTALENVSRRCLDLLFSEEQHQDKGTSEHGSKLLVVVDENENISRGSKRWSFRSPTVSPSKDIPKIPEPFHHISLVDSEGDTPLHTAVRAGDLTQVKLCLDHGADILARQNDQETPLHYACSKSDLECVKLMLESRPDEMRTCLTMVNRSGYTPLHIATLYDHVPLLEYLVEQGAPIEATDSTGLTSLLLGATKGSYRSCSRLIDLGANVASRDMNERTIVHLMMLHYQSGVQALLRIFELATVSQELIFKKDSFGSTPLHYASERGLHFVVKCLLHHGVTILDRNADGDTPLHLAAQYGRDKVVQYLLESPEGIRALYQEDFFGRNPLHRAVTQGHVHITQMLLEKGGIFRKCHAGNSPLHLAARCDQLDICQVLLKLSPSLLDQVNFEGLTALHFAAMYDCSDVVDFLLTSGAKILPSNDGIYFVTDALSRRHCNTLQAIIKHQRWPEIWNQFDGTPQCVLDGLIREIPSLYELVMSQSITRQKDEKTGNRTVTYDFSVLSREKDIDERIKDPMHRVTLMAQLQRRDLLFHPLCQTYLDLKWKIYGRWIHFFQIAYFALILAVITAYVVNDELPEVPYMHIGDNQLSVEARFTRLHRFRIFSWVLFGIISLHILLKLFQLKQQRLEYFHDWTNTLELLLLCLANTLFIDGVLGGQIPNRKIFTAFLMLLSWFNFMLQISRVKYVGIFIVMFLQVFTTVVKCLSVFSIVVIGFGFVFHVLLREPDYRIRREMLSRMYDNVTHDDNGMPSREFQISEREQFDYLGISIFKTIMMMFGEYEHSRTLIYPLFGSAEEATIGAALLFIFYIAFLLFVPIILMNLLIGLAVGDIDEVRKTACQKLIIQQIYWLADLELKFPRKIRHKIFKSSISKTEYQRQKNLKHHECPMFAPKYGENTTEKKLQKLEQLILNQNNQLRNLAEKIEVIVACPSKENLKQ